MSQVNGLASDTFVSREFDAITGFVDLAGFTAAAETFSHSGARGTERLVQLINSLFTPAISAIEAAGGEVGWFAGDAMGVLFDQAYTSFGEAVEALAHASQLIASLPPVVVDGRDVRLDAKVGIAAGPVRWESILGDQVTTWFGGDAIDLSVAAEHHAVPGDLILHESVHGHLPNLAAEAIETGFVRLRAASVELTGSRHVAGAQQSLRERRDLSYQPPKVARLSGVEHGMSRIAEHRPVTVFFAAMPTSTHDPEQLLALRTSVEQQGGMLSGVTEGDKGAVLLAVFGAPISHPERADRALQAASQVREQIPDVRIGVTTGRVFAGPVGSTSRWDYTVIGDRVNVAARLMQASAPGEILVDRLTIRDSRRRVTVGDERALELKGKSAHEIAVPVLSLGSRESSVLLGSSRTSFVGREDDVASLRAALAGDQSLILLSGDAGSGKSRLVDHLVGLHRSSRFVISWLEQADVSRSFQLWRRLLERAVGPARTVIDVLSNERRNDPRLPVANAILGADLSETVLTTNLSSAERFEVVVSVVEDIFSELIDGRDVVIEDLHWADDQSLELLRRLAPRLYGSGVHLLAASRPDARVDSLVDVAVVHGLGDLGAAALADLATDRWISTFGRPPRPGLVDALAERGAGSPLFVEQLVELAHDVGVDSDIEAWPSELEFPTNLTDVVLSRLDRLPDVAGSVAKLASILGRTFSTDDLVGSFATSHTAEVLLAGLDLLVDTGFVVFGTPNHFHHALFAEAAYERMAFGERGLFHRDVLLHLERIHPDPSRVATDLARHAEHTDDDDRKRKYYSLAGEEAMRAYVPSVSIRWFNQLLPLLPEVERVVVNFKLGRMHMVSGDYVTAERELAQAISALNGDDLVAAQTERAEALIRSGTPAEGFAILETLAARLEVSEDWPNLRKVLDDIGYCATSLEDVDRLERLEQRWKVLCERSGAGVLREPLDGLIHLKRFRGDLRGARADVSRARDRAVAEGDLFRAARWTCDVAGLSFELHDVATSLSELGDASLLMVRVGNRSERLAFVTLNEVLMREELGDGPGALLLAHHGLDDALQIDQRMAIADFSRVIGSLTSNRTWLLRALVWAHQVGHLGALLDAVEALGRLSVASDRAPEALDFLDVVALHRPLGVATKLDMMRARLALSEDTADLMDDLAATDPDLTSLDNRQAQVLSFRAEQSSDPAFVSVAALACRVAFDEFPSAEINRCLERLTGERCALPFQFADVGEVRSTSEFDVLGRRLDGLLGIFDDASELERRGAQIVAELGTTNDARV